MLTSGPRQPQSSLSTVSTCAFRRREGVSATSRVSPISWGLILLAGVSILAGCRREPAKPAPSPVPLQHAVPSSTFDIKPVLREFLKSAPADWYLVTAAAVAREKAFLVDVRQPEEYRQGFIAGALNVPLRELVASLDALPGFNQRIVVVCDTGHRSAIGMALLRMLGYRDVLTLDGGMQAWRLLNFAAVTGPVPASPARSAPAVDAELQAALDYYLRHTLPFNWGIIDGPALTRDQAREAPEAMAYGSTLFEQGHSFLTDVDEPSELEVARHRTTSLAEVINLPLHNLIDSLDRVPMREAVAQS
jgi:rhodanese-related sulfurtransferase